MTTTENGAKVHVFYSNKDTGLTVGFNFKEQPLLFEGTFFGCHGQIVNNILNTPYAQGINWKNYYNFTETEIELFLLESGLILNQPLKGEFKSCKDAYKVLYHASASCPPPKETRPVEDRIAYTVKELNKEARLYVFFPVMNYGKGGRPAGYDTWKVIQEIVKQRLGHLTASPVVVNPRHNGVSGTQSYVQSFLWITSGCKDKGIHPIKETQFSRSLDKEFKTREETEEAAARGGKAGDLFHNMKALL